jgi:hypothetical protein
MMMMTNQTRKELTKKSNQTAMLATKENKKHKQTKTRNNRHNKRIHPETLPLKTKLFRKQIIIKDDESIDDTGDTGNSKATSHSMTSKNATTVISKKYLRPD